MLTRSVVLISYQLYVLMLMFILPSV